MARLTRLTAALLAALMVLAVATPAVLASEPVSIDVEQGDTSYTVNVTHNGTPVNDTTVNVTTTDPNASYAGDSGVTDANGSVTFGLPENETEVNISTTYNGSEFTKTTTLQAANETEMAWDGEGPFGRWVSQMVDKLKGMDLDGPLGQHVSAIVTENNPGADNRSDNANPGGNGNGPPEHAGNNSDNGGGPPDHANNDKDKGDDTSSSDVDDGDDDESDD